VPPTSQLLAFLAVSLVLIVIPGPSVLFIVSRGVALGGGAAVRTALGNAIGAMVLVAAVAFGLGALIGAATVSYEVIRLLGAAYLVYLGVQAIRHRRELVVPDAQRSNRRVLAEGFIVGLTNPKTAVFFAAVLPQFIDPARCSSRSPRPATRSGGSSPVRRGPGSRPRHADCISWVPPGVA
jgi:threonine/homoserine/homoserine lactone efflux protein